MYCKAIHQVATTRRAFTKIGKQNLLNVLNKRITDEFSKYKYDQSFSVYLNLSGFELEDTANSIFTYLRKTQGLYKLEINFEAKILTSKDHSKISKMINQDVSQDYWEFNLFLTKTLDNSGFYADCVCLEDKMLVKSLTHSKDMKIFEDPLAAGKIYQGPNLTIAKQLYIEHFLTFLQSFGLTKELLHFIRIYSADKEHRLYMSWLVKTRDFLLKR